MLIVPAKHMTLVAAHGSTASAYSQLFELGEFNYLQVQTTVHTLFGVGTPPVVHLQYTLQGSNDGQEFFTVTGISDDQTAVGTAESAGAVAAARFRFKFEVTLSSSSPGDWGVVVFCAHAKLARAPN